MVDSSEKPTRHKQTDPDVDVVDQAVRLIYQVCCLAGCFDLLEELRDPALAAAVERHHTSRLFDRLMYDVSFQEISDAIAINYMAKHGRATWHLVAKNLAAKPSCPKLLLAFSPLPLRKDEWHLRRA